MLPQGSDDPLTAVPSLARQSTRPVAALRAYSELRSVAAITRAPATSGWA